MSTLQIQLLRDFQISYQGKPLSGFESPRLRSLLAYLLLHRDAPQSRKHLAFLLWQDSPEAQAHGSLRSLFLRLRKVLPEAGRFIAADTHTLQWRADAPFTLDVDDFEKVAAQTASRAALEKAVNLYRGELLPACYDEWLLPERERLRELYVDSLARLVGLSEEAQEYQTAIGYTRRLLHADPVGEEAYRKLMQLYARTGDRANVVRVYQTCVAVMKRELDAEPGLSTRQLFEQLRDAELPLARPAQTRVQVKPNLPIPLTSFVGRVHELGEIATLFKRARLITLVGVGGGGKTRLAIQAAQGAARGFADGAWFVDFAALSESAAVPEMCAAVFGLREQPGKSATERVAEYLRDKELVLVFDNCEHLLTGCADLAQTILQAAPRVRILATSREPLNLSGEALLNVPPLSLPDPKHVTLEALLQSDAVQLFNARAAFSMPTFTLNQGNLKAVGQICRRLDGIPLAIELAASRIRALTPTQIAARLDDVLTVLTRGSPSGLARHQTMRGVLDWSDALLSAPERALFRRLAVFAGSFSLDAAEQVCRDETGKGREDAGKHSFVLLAPAILDLLSDLIDKSLVTAADAAQSDEARYRLLEPIRQYAREKLRAAGEEEKLHRAHSHYFAHRVQQADAEFYGARQIALLEWMDDEHDNVRAALEWQLRRAQLGDHAAALEGLQTAAGMWWYWDLRGYVREGRARFEPFILLAQALPPSAAVAYAYIMFGQLTMLQGDHEIAVAFPQRALEMGRQLDDERIIMLATQRIAIQRARMPNPEEAIPFIEQALALGRRSQHRHVMYSMLLDLAEIAHLQHDEPRARAAFDEALELIRAQGDQWNLSAILYSIGVYRWNHDDKAALESFRASLNVKLQMNDVRGLAYAFDSLAWVAARSAEPDRAARLFGAADALFERMGARLFPRRQPPHDEAVERARRALGDAVFALDFATGRALSLDDAIQEAFAVAL